MLRIASPNEAIGRRAAETVEQFGASWHVHDHKADYFPRQFQDWILPFSPADFAGKSVLEAGCGKGRHSRAILGWSPARLVAVDLSSAVELAAASVGDCETARFVQADILCLPFACDQFDVVVCVGVLHHLADPEKGLAELWRVLRPGGTLVLWIYAREGNGWIVALVDPIRKAVTSRIPAAALRPLATLAAAALYLPLKLLYRPSRRWPRIARLLPYQEYLAYISDFPFHEIEHIALDHLCPPIAHYVRRITLEDWLTRLGAASATFRWHHKNSWTVIAKKPAIEKERNES